VTRAALPRLLRLLVAAGLTIWLLWISHPSEILRAARDARLDWILLACALVLFDRALMAWRWLVLLRPLTVEAPPPFSTVMRIFFVSTFLGTFLPASVGADAVRAFSFARAHGNGSAGVASVVMDRALGVLSILILGAAALAAGMWGRGFEPGQAPPPGVVLVLGVGALACLALATVVFSERAAALSVRLMDAVPAAPVRRIGRMLLEAVREYRHHHRALLTVLLASIGVQIFRVIQAWCLGRALHIDAGLGTYFACIPVVLLIMLLPVTVNGIGTSQAAFVWTFGASGIPRAEAFALSVLFVALGIVGNLPGGLLYAFGPSGRRL
jgi:glycosyltransferase 2 family protein